MNIAEEKHPDAVKIVMGDFNSLKMDSHLPHYKQFVTFPTRDDNILDMFYCNIKDSYSAYKKAPLGASDHNIIHLFPKYRQIIKREKPTEVHVTKWSTERVDVLRGCFDITDWSVFQSDYYAPYVTKVKVLKLISTQALTHRKNKANVHCWPSGDNLSVRSPVPVVSRWL